jgi:hypothetical protein
LVVCGCVDVYSRAGSTLQLPPRTRLYQYRLRTLYQTHSPPTTRARRPLVVGGSYSERMRSTCAEIVYIRNHNYPPITSAELHSGDEGDMMFSQNYIVLIEHDRLRAEVVAISRCDWRVVRG